MPNLKPPSNIQHSQIVEYNIPMIVIADEGRRVSKRRKRLLYETVMLLLSRLVTL